MSRVALLFSIGLLVGWLTAAGAQEETFTPNDLNSRLKGIKNPFKSSLPASQPEIKATEPVPPVEKAIRTTEEPAQKAPTAKAEPPPVPKFTVTGVIWETDRPQAIMNGQIVNIGDTISGVEIHSIEKAKISGFYYGQKIIIKP